MATYKLTSSNFDDTPAVASFVGLLRNIESYRLLLATAIDHWASILPIVIFLQQYYPF